MRLVAVVGPTATGKSRVALALAEALGGEIVSCDSTAVYRGLDIGTDKLPDAERRGIPHHLVDVAAPTEVYSAARYAVEAAAAAQAIEGRGRVPILAGGTGFYYRALVRGLFQARRATASSARGWNASPAGVASRRSIDGWRVWTRGRPGASCRAIANASCARSRSTC
jgi:tRNA dimethylallyltransferase